MHRYVSHGRAAENNTFLPSFPLPNFFGTALLLIAFTITYTPLFSQQQDTGQKVRPSATAKMNFKDVEKHEKEHPPEIQKGELNENDNKLPRHLPIPKGGKTKLYKVPPSGRNDTASVHKKKKPST
ncbi:MAG TPA: hypothetical protein VFA55_04165, partial [Candidatus Kapabacteria bacterium]|nr:hypothetical protein [Candidatus Kapabacteria bacterium]